MQNTIGKWVTTVTIYDPERRALWEKIFPGARVPIVSIIPIAVDVPERGVVPAYMLDLVALTDDQRDGVCKILAARFNIPLDEVRVDLWMGVPILVDNVQVSSTVGFSSRVGVPDEELFVIHRYEDGEPNDDEEE